MVNLFLLLALFIYKKLDKVVNDLKLVGYASKPCSVLVDLDGKKKKEEEEGSGPLP